MKSTKKKAEKKPKMFDVVAVSTDDRKVLWTYGSRDEKNAEAVISMAVYRQGVEDRFFTTAKPGRFKEGDKYVSEKP